MHAQVKKIIRGLNRIDSFPFVFCAIAGAGMALAIVLCC